jgi:hypothetical protein
MVGTCQTSTGTCTSSSEDLQLLAGFAKDFGNVNIIPKERPITNLDTRFLTRALRIMRAFIDQINLAQSTNLPIIICRDKIYKCTNSTLSTTQRVALKRRWGSWTTPGPTTHLAMKLNSPVVQRWLSAIPPSPPREAVRLRRPSAQKGSPLRRGR